MRARWWIALATLAVPLSWGCRGRFKLAADARFVEEMAIGDGFVCGRMKDGSVRCWGVNSAGELGAGEGDTPLESVRVAGLSEATAVAAGGSHACAITRASEAFCWGSHAPPSRVEGLKAKQIAAGARHSCALSDAGEVSCWGANDAGQLLDDASRASLRGTVGLAAGVDGTCAIAPDRTVRCWGRIPGHGQIGVTRIEGLADVTAVSIGEAHACAVKAWGGIACWGANREGQLGDGSFTDRVQPVDVSGLAAPAKAVAVGRKHTCALLGEGTIRCWGGNNFSQLADGTTGHRASPALIQGLFEVQGVSVGGDATCVRFTDGSARCWGGLRLPKTDGNYLPVPTEVRW